MEIFFLLKILELFILEITHGENNKYIHATENSRIIIRIEINYPIVFPCMIMIEFRLV